DVVEPRRYVSVHQPRQPFASPARPLQKVRALVTLLLQASQDVRGHRILHLRRATPRPLNRIVGQPRPYPPGGMMPESSRIRRVLPRGLPRRRHPSILAPSVTVSVTTAKFETSRVNFCWSGCFAAHTSGMTTFSARTKSPSDYTPMLAASTWA